MDEYKIIYNLKDEFKIYEKSLTKEGYAIVAKKEDIVLIKKSDKELTQNQINAILEIAIERKRIVKGILFVDITEVVNKIFCIENPIKNGTFRWQLKNIITRATKNKTRLREQEIKVGKDENGNSKETVFFE